MLSFDRQIQISVGKSRKDTHWKAQKLTVSELYDKLQNPSRGTETLEQYLKLKKIQQDELKDVGGFVAGSLMGERRKANAVIGRDVVTLDFDNIPSYGTDGVIQSVDALGCGYCIYSTRKHMETGPRLRILIPLDRTVTADEYEPIARYLAKMVGIQMADPTTFEASRLMYWPSVCADGQYIHKVKDAAFAYADGILATYKDWHNYDEWPQVPGALSYQKLAVKQGDPEEKPGIVGVFCREYDVFAAMDKFLPDIYAPVDNDANRFTYLNGSTAGGAVIYDHGKFLYSHHATDPCSNKLVNAFDLVRLHKFGDKDDDVKPDTPFNRLPSYKAMCELATADPKVATRIIQERRDQAIAEFEGVSIQQPVEEGQDTNWIERLAVNAQGAVKPTIDNILVILNNDPMLKGKFALNQFAGRGEVLADLPWSNDGPGRLWSDTDSNGLYWYMERFYAITSRGNIDAALDIHASTHAFNPVKDYIKGLMWDGVKRLDTLFCDYLGAKDDAYTRAVCRKIFTAAIARAMTPGCKFDNMLILCGPQGIGKSTLLDRMSRGWFNDSIRTFEGKEAAELLPAVWLVEVAELDAFRRTDVARIKQFLSLRADRYRAAYGRNMKEQPRSCVFFGTCNQMDFLQDTTGNRRFWPVDVGVEDHTLKAWELTPETVDQIWAEAKAYWQCGEPLYLSGEIEEEAKKIQEGHREASPREGLILDFINRPIPNDWYNWPLDRRRDYWSMNAQGEYQLVERERICAAEVWCELFNGNIRDLGVGNRDSREINNILASLPGWKRICARFGYPYGTQRGFKKC
ncbi:MAG: virulence-associated protein E [Lachnospiraceae bacterium]|nr:virulence-associated protein E [Lachnospiraceae bacterium]